MESTRAQEEAVRKQTNEELEAFRRQREQAEKASRVEDSIEDITQDVQWHSGTRKKRKIVEKDSLKGVKLRRISSAGSGKVMEGRNPDTSQEILPPDSVVSPDQTTKLEPPGPRSRTLLPVGRVETEPDQTKPASNPVIATPVAGLGLDGYSSDED